MNEISNKNDVLILFTRYPVNGNTKTRLIPALGEEGAAVLQRQMTEYALEQVLGVDAQLQILFSGGSIHDMQEWLGSGYEYIEQIEGDIGRRMEVAFKKAFDRGAQRVVLLGTDCPDNRTINIKRCFKKLEKYPCVIGPSDDGGYYMIGLSHHKPELFRGVNWSTSSVFDETVSMLDSYFTLETFVDVDEIENLPRRISVIIPALNEEDNIERCVRSVHLAFNTECIVVDGGSSDATLQKALIEGCTALECNGGRAVQMNYGAKVSTGEILLFLHADSELPCGWDTLVRAAFEDSRVQLGCFGFKVRDRIPWIALVEYLVWIRSKLLKKPYGDQALFLEYKVFENRGGYPEVPILEDLMLVKNVGASGRVVQLEMDVLTSGRRWQKLGVLKTTLINQGVLIAALLGVDLQKICKAYRKGENPLPLLWKR